MSDNPQEHLGKAGEGLPKPQALLLRYLGFPTLRQIISWEKALAIFETEGDKVQNLVQGLDQEKMHTKVLVPRLLGLEDNSRYYSAAMVLWHLTYVGETICDGIIALSRGEQLDFTVKIENFKPFVEIGTDVIESYHGLIGSFRSKLDNNVWDRHNNNFHSHPWFGPLNPHGWLVLSAVHQIIHRRQLEGIIKGLQQT
jgi:hypothetical protein